jgi:hypothetical protein
VREAEGRKKEDAQARDKRQKKEERRRRGGRWNRGTHKALATISVCRLKLVVYAALSY